MDGCFWGLLSDLDAMWNLVVCSACPQTSPLDLDSGSTILANVFAIGTIHGGLRSLYPYVLEILIWLSIGEQGIQALQKWINQGKGGS